MRNFDVATANLDGVKLKYVTPEHTKLNLGCGFNKKLDYWNVDIESKCNPDQIVNLEQTPWPWEDNFFTEICADNILEHLGQNPKDFTNIMKEMYRVSCDQAVWTIVIPHHRSDLLFDDYTHVRALTTKTFKMFDQQYNVESIKAHLSDSTFGLYHDIDIEIVNTDYKFVQYWIDLYNGGMLGKAEFEIKMNTLSNFIESVFLYVKVHKPGRHVDFLKTN